MMDTSFDKLKSICEKACRKRQACRKGYRQMRASETVSQMMATWRDNWEDIVTGKFADIIRQQLPALYPELREEMNRSGIYVNECPMMSPDFVKVFVLDTDDEVHIFDHASAYILGKASVMAHDHSRVYNTSSDAHVTLYDYSHGDIRCGEVSAYNRSMLQCNCKASLYDSCDCNAIGGNIRAYSFRHLTASGNAVVYAASHERVLLSEQATCKQLNHE